MVGEFDYVEGKTKEGVEIRVYTPPEKKSLGTFALDVGGNYPLVCITFTIQLLNGFVERNFKTKQLCSSGTILFYRLLCYPLSLTQIGYASYPRLLCRRDGELVKETPFLSF